MAALENPFLRFLEDQPRTAFLGAASPFMQTEGNRRISDTVFQRLQDDFLAEISGRVLRNESPSLMFTDFMKDMDFSKRFANVRNLTPSTARFSPKTRRLFFG